MTDPRDPLEPHLSDELAALVGGEQAPVDLADRAHDRLRAHPERRGRLIAAAVGVAALIAAVALIAIPDDDQGGVRALGDGSTTTTETTTTTTPTTTGSTSTTEAVVPPPVETPSTTAEVTTTSIEPAPQPRCVEATSGKDENDGWEPHWATDPGANAPAAIRVCVDDITPRVGQVVHVTVVGDDPDAVLVDEECGWLVRFDGLASLCRDYVIMPEDEPRPTPTKRVGHIERTATRAFDRAGWHAVVGSISSSAYDGTPHPYASYVSVVIPVEVHD